MALTWDDNACTAFINGNTSPFPRQFLEMVYATRLLGTDPDLALHGGGNTSFKTTVADLTGRNSEALFIKASGCDMGKATKDDFVIIDRLRLEPLKQNTRLEDSVMAAIFTTSLLYPHPCKPSIETLLHVFLPFTCIVHTHPAPILTLTNRQGSHVCINEAFSQPVAVIDYAEVGILLARSAVEAVNGVPGCRGLLIRHHGLVTWGADAREAFNGTVALVEEAGKWIASHRNAVAVSAARSSSVETARERYRELAPLIRGCLTPGTETDTTRNSICMTHHVDKEILAILDDESLPDLMASTPLTADHIIRVRRLPLLLHNPDINNIDLFRERLTTALAVYSNSYEQFVEMEQKRLHHSSQFDSINYIPYVVLIPGLGIVCTGRTLSDARIAGDITLQGFAVKKQIVETGGTYEELGNEHCFNMEFRSYQRAKVSSPHGDSPLRGRIVLVTGAAGAIGSGICASLLQNGCQVAVSDLPGEPLMKLVDDFIATFDRDTVIAVPIDVTDEQSIHEGFSSINERFGGIDAIVVNAGIAHVAMLAEMELEAFRRLEKVNTEGTLLTIREAAQLFELQNTGGDIVLISTKNVFAPGASFGAYSATKAASHQIARIASLELAPIDVRVNMVAPDAVFSHGSHKSGLWATVGPDRMKSRGLDQAGLEEYYRNRNLLKSKVTAEHVAAAVQFFLTRQTPTTGATIPVDGGLPDATPR
jgi:rhamnose utilization protein RhaD (predicted bifunctional aldolase and dehydrogenase)/NAD(P)-dependent dehydrogenase (short-subunit alcohol dehydrogenase family)